MWVHEVSCCFGGLSVLRRPQGSLWITCISSEPASSRLMLSKATILYPQAIWRIIENFEQQCRVYLMLVIPLVDGNNRDISITIFVVEGFKIDASCVVFKHYSVLELVDEPIFRKSMLWERAIRVCIRANFHLKGPMVGTLGLQQCLELSSRTLTATHQRSDGGPRMRGSTNGPPGFSPMPNYLQRNFSKNAGGLYNNSGTHFVEMMHAESLEISSEGPLLGWAGAKQEIL